MGWIIKLLAGKAGPWVLLALAFSIAGGAWWLRTSSYNAGESAGITSERNKWLLEKGKAEALANQLAEERQARANDAAASRAERDKLYANRVQPITLEVREYAKTPAASARCIDPVGVHLGQQAIATANTAIAGNPGQRGGSVPASSSDVQ